MPSNGGPSGTAGTVFSRSGGVNYAATYAKQIDERFSRASVVAPATNNMFKFDGVNKVTVFSIDTVDLTDYTPHGANRFGNPVELGNGEQELVLTRRRSFSFTIDARSSIATNGTQVAGAALDRELREVCVPEYDRYVLGKLVDSAKTANKVTVNMNAATAGDDAYDKFIDAQEAMGNARVPLENRTAFVSEKFYGKLKKSGYVTDSNAGQEIKNSGEIHKVDGTRLIRAPSDLLPDNVHVIVIASNLVLAPRPISYYNIHKNPPGIHGDLVEGEFLYDAFVLNNKKDAIFVISHSST